MLKKILYNRINALKRNRTFCLICKVVMLGSLIIYIFLYGSASVSTNASSSFRNNPDKPSPINKKIFWTWECQEGNCVRVAQLSSFSKLINNFSSIGECRLVCSPFSTIWPIPTGHFSISRETKAVNITGITMNIDQVRGDHEAKDFVQENGGDLFIRNLFALCPQSERVQYYVKQKVVVHSDDNPRFTTPRASVKINIVTSDSDMTLDWSTDESYKLHINTTHEGLFVEISATNVFGVRHGLQTLSQLFACRKSDVNTLIMMSEAKISDKPVYSHRGVLLDTARTFLPVKSILRTLDGMAASKLNVFHWHATDSHSFPLYSTNVPNLTRFGAYSEAEIYMPEDIKLIRDYAFIRGIRIILEIDAPSHAGYGWQWGESAGLGNLAVCVGYEPWHECCIQPPCGQLNPSNPNLYKVLEQLYSDIRERFPHDMFHMGGDEVFFPCWLSSDEITSYMSSIKLNQTSEGYLELWAQFQQRALEAWDTAAPSKNKNKSINPIILWSSALTEPQHIRKYLNPERYIIETWTERGSDEPLQLLALGYKLIMATKDAWYLDHGFRGNTVYHKWSDVYDNMIYPPDQGVYGGEACMWTEYVGDSNLDGRLWPRLACLGERLWSNPSSSSVTALPRLLDHTERLATLGLQPDVILPEWCMQSDGKC